MQRTVRTPDGRTLAVETAGDLAASLASLAPYGAEGLDWFAGMGQDNVDEFELLLADQNAARAKIDKERDETLASSAGDLAQMLESLLTPVDAAVLEGKMAEYLSYADHEGSRRAARDGGTTAAPRSGRGGSS
jgi:hypothetical protein